MRRWFNALALHRKLVAMALAVSVAALVTATIGLVAFDVARFRTATINGTRILSEIIAENIAAALVFNDVEVARETLSTVRTHELMTLACVYQVDGSLFARYEQTPDNVCPARPAAFSGWRAVATVVPVMRNDAVVGTVYVERAMSDLGTRVAVTTAAGGAMLLLAGALALAVAQRLQRVISRPITRLAQAARAVGGDQRYEMPAIDAPPDETGDLVRAFSDMVLRMSHAREELLASNQALQREVDERSQMQAERERLLAREQQANRLKDEFLAAVSHELRTPLNVILGWAQLLATARPSEPTLSNAITSMLRNAQAQSRVIEDLMDVSRITTGKLHLKLEPLDFRSVVDGAVEVIEPLAAAKSIRIQRDLPASTCLVNADPDRLRQIVWNLLSNATKFTPPGGSVRVRLTGSADACSLAVSDSGIGIPRTFLPHVFERFRQADGSTSREHEGLGLGLAIVKDLTELHGGTVLATSEGPGTGATFSVTLPRYAGTLPAGANQSAWADAWAVPILKGLRVLAIDDNADTLEVLGSALGGAGAMIRLASSGAEAIEIWQSERFDVVLCDLAMPGMDGFAVLSGIRHLDARTGRTTPVLALTAYASEESRAECLRAGFHGHIAKPYDAEELTRAVAEATGRVRIPDSEE